MVNELTRTIMANLSARREAQPCSGQTPDRRLSAVEENSLRGLMHAPQQFRPVHSEPQKHAAPKMVTLSELAQMQR